MTKVFFSVGITLDGFLAPEGMDLAHADDPTYKDWLGQWMALQSWISQPEFFRKKLKLGQGGGKGGAGCGGGPPVAAGDAFAIRGPQASLRVRPWWRQNAWTAVRATRS